MWENRFDVRNRLWNMQAIESNGMNARYRAEQMQGINKI